MIQLRPSVRDGVLLRLRTIKKARKFDVMYVISAVDIGSAFYTVLDEELQKMPSDVCWLSLDLAKHPQPTKQMATETSATTKPTCKRFRHTHQIPFRTHLHHPHTQTPTMDNPANCTDPDAGNSVGVIAESTNLPQRERNNQVPDFRAEKSGQAQLQDVTTNPDLEYAAC